MTTVERSSRPTPSRMLSWLVGCVIVAWLVIYNVIRLGGSSPSDAARPSAILGLVVGVLMFAGGLVVARRLAASGRVLRPAHGAVPAAGEMDSGQRDAVRLAWPPLGALGLVALVVGAYLAVDWISHDPASRAKTTALLAVWNVVFGLWVADEALRLRRGEADGIDSIVFACSITAVLAGVGLARDLANPGQVALIVLAGVAGGLVGLAVWRLRGARGLPAGAIAVVVVAALALVLALTG